MPWLPRNSRKTERGAGQFLIRLVVRAAPFAVLRNATIAWSLTQALTYGEDTTTAAFHTDPVEVWGSRFLILTICVGIALLLFTLIKYRGKTAGAVSWGLLAGGIALVP